MRAERHRHVLRVDVVVQRVQAVVQHGVRSMLVLMLLMMRVAMVTVMMVSTTMVVVVAVVERGSFWRVGVLRSHFILSSGFPSAASLGLAEGLAGLPDGGQRGEVLVVEQGGATLRRVVGVVRVG